MSSTGVSPSHNLEPPALLGTLGDPWKVTEVLKARDLSVWTLERVKARAEEPLQPEDQNSCIGLRYRGLRRVYRTALFASSVFAALCLFAIYLTFLRLCQRSSSLPKKPRRLVAVHGEWSTRTRHVLKAVPRAEPPIDAILIVGRQKWCWTKIARLWGKELAALDGMAVATPLSFKAAGAALADLPSLFLSGLRAANAAERLLGLRGELALAFRVLLGATNGRWWGMQRVNADIEVLFGCTGTADTTLLERAIQDRAGRTIHLVHGQAVGPNFAGISNCAVFRSQFDADTYDAWGCYKVSHVQLGSRPNVRRGNDDILLLSNLAHPMNPGFQRNGISEEINLLASVGRAARLVVPENVALLWKPHPVIYGLDQDLLRQVRNVAEAYGFQELSADTGLAEASENARWVICSPSTVALDLLQLGTLSIVLDPQRSTTTTALSAFPRLPSLEPEALAAMMGRLDNCETYMAELNRVYESILPAEPLDLAKPFSGATWYE